MTEQQARYEVKCHVCGNAGVEGTVRDEIITLHCPMCGDYIMQHRCAMLPLGDISNEKTRKLSSEEIDDLYRKTSG